MKTILISITAALLLASGCATLEDRCLERFPPSVTTEVREVVKTDTILLAGVEIPVPVKVPCPPNLADTLWVSDTVYYALPPRIIEHETICMDTVIVAADTERVAYLRELLAAAHARHQAQRSTLSLHYWLFAALGAGMMLMMWLAFRRKR